MGGCRQFNPIGFKNCGHCDGGRSRFPVGNLRFLGDPIIFLDGQSS